MSYANKSLTQKQNLVMNNNKEVNKMILQYYEEILKELEELEINLDTLSNKDMHQALQVLINRGWSNISLMFGKHKKSKLTKEEAQEHFNTMLKVVPMTTVKKVKREK